MKAIVEAKFDPIMPRDLAIMADLQSRHLSSIGEWGDAYVLCRLVP